MHAKHKDFEDKLKENTLKRKPFDAKINEKSKADATQFKLRQTAKQEQMDVYDYGMEDSPGAAEMDDYSNGNGMLDGDMGGDDIDAKMRQEELS